MTTTISCAHGARTTIDPNEQTFRSICVECPPMTICRHDGCSAVFYVVMERGESADLCIEHAADVDRARNGWTVANSVD